MFAMLKKKKAKKAATKSKPAAPKRPVFTQEDIDRLRQLRVQRKEKKLEQRSKIFLDLSEEMRVAVLDHLCERAVDQIIYVIHDVSVSPSQEERNLVNKAYEAGNNLYLDDSDSGDEDDKMLFEELKELHLDISARQILLDDKE